MLVDADLILSLGLDRATGYPGLVNDSRYLVHLGSRSNRIISRLLRRHQRLQPSILLYPRRGPVVVQVVLDLNLLGSPGLFDLDSGLARLLARLSHFLLRGLLSEVVVQREEEQGGNEN